MKVVRFLLFFFICLSLNAQLPKGFVYAKDVIPDLDVELRYYGTNNFVGKRIKGYRSHRLVLTKAAALALKKVQDDLQDKNYCLKVYDGYRPQLAVNHFVAWTKDVGDTINKTLFYPRVLKRRLFAEGYIASKSGHSKGSTVDVTITDGNTGEPIDMGSPYDFFGPESWVKYAGLTAKQQANRNLLQEVMAKHGFRGYSKEWWHFTLRQEPFPNTFFDFPIE